eukprot:1152225-Pelagomonas_calceolata.AAC.6
MRSKREGPPSELLQLPLATRTLCTHRGGTSVALKPQVWQSMHSFRVQQPPHTNAEMKNMHWGLSVETVQPPFLDR